MRSLKVIVSSVCLLLAACAGNRSATAPTSNDFVEVENPFQTMSPGQPASVWVPRSSVEGSAVPRGKELVKQGAEQLLHADKQSAPQEGSPARQQTASATAPSPAAGRVAVAVEPAPAVKSRIALLELGQNGLVHPLNEDLRRAAIGVMLDPAQAAFLAQYATITNQAEKGAFAKRLQQDYGVNVVVYVTAPDGAAPGKTLTAEVFDAMGGGLLRRLDAAIPPFAAADQAARDAAVAKALTTLTGGIKDLVALLPWYGRITAVEGNRAYIAAGREVGLRVGQVLKVYHDGKFVDGLGFAPGEQVGTLQIGGFVGPNGSFAAIKEGQGVRAADVVSVE